MDYPYESLSYAGRLTFRDARGLDAVFECYQRFRVLIPDLLRVKHWIWGDGEQLLGLESPSVQLAHEVTREGRRVLVSALNRPARTGDEIEVYSTRRIHHAFKDTNEWWEFMPFTPTQRARVAISFPIGREPEGISVSTSAGARSPFVSRPGTKELIFTVDSPAIGSLYHVSWSW